MRELRTNYALNQLLTVQSPLVFIHSVQWQQKLPLVRSKITRLNRHKLIMRRVLPISPQQIERNAHA
jgi:hypothetical protein